MEPATDSFGQLAAHSRDLARRLLVIGENRIELLKVEVQEERAGLLLSILLAFGTAVFVLLSGIALTAAIVVWLWAYSPVAVLLAVTGVYGVAGVCLYRRFTGLMRDRKILSATFDQLGKDPWLFGKRPGRSPLETRKQLLIAESELNRTQLAADIAALKAGAGTITDCAKSFGSIASSAGVLAAGLAGSLHGKHADRRGRSSWLPTVIKGAGLVSSLWLAFRSYGHQNKSPNPRR
jgi:uncharacterized membrane protein YqjE